MQVVLGEFKWGQSAEFTFRCLALAVGTVFCAGGRSR
jgi:hypothetical protein